MVLGFRKIYEYKIFRSKDPMTDERSHVFYDTNITLNAMGEDGWELIGVILNMKTMEYVYYFKRTK